jgi:hypothetical protein
MQFAGLGIQNLSKFNQALLGKWCFATKREAFWHLVVETKYRCIKRGWCTKAAEGPFGVVVRKHIRREWGVFSRSLRFEVGDCSNIRF